MGRVEAHLPRVQDKAAKIYNDLIDETLKNLRAAKALQHKDVADRWADGIVFDAALAGDRFVSDLSPETLAMLEEAGIEAVGEIGADVVFDLTDPAVRGFIRTREKHIKTIAFNFHDDVRKELAAGYREGEAVTTIAKRIEGFREGVQFQADRIAQTEILGASNRGGFEGYKQAGVAKKQWVHTFTTENPREQHEAIDQAGPIPIAQDFVSTLGGSGPCPGSMNSAADDIRCTCTIAAAVS